MTTVAAATRIRSLRNGGVAVVLTMPRTGLPEVLHWGRDLGELTAADAAALRLATRRQVSPSALDAAWPLTILPGEHDGWEGRPGLAGHRGGAPLLADWVITDVSDDVSADAADPCSLRVTAAADGLRLDVVIALDDAGVLRVTPELHNTGASAVELSLFEATMPVGDAATDVLDFTGRWTRERSPQRRPLVRGSQVRESRRGRTGHDSPFVLAIGTSGFSASAGEIWAVHLAWSADSVYRHDALPEAATLLGAGALIRPGEIVVEPGGAHRAPTAVFVWSDAGLDGIASRVHRSLRARPAHPSSSRPVTLNTWEAVYFRHDLDTLDALAETAASIGVERFVLDDGWFVGRRGDSAGLGDWRVDRDVWPNGLAPLAAAVRGRGMQLGLWFEPEMVNPQSALAREHPDWLLHPAPRPGRSWRNQFVLDVAREEVFDELLGAISAIVGEYDLDYIKWDQNRDLLEAVHHEGGSARAGVIRHTEAVYRLMDALRLRHPGLEIESCASGGARIDLGVLEHTDRVWASDTNDPVERLAIQRWTELLVPLESIGAHVGPAQTHTTRRVTDLDFRIAVAIFGHFGIEWDITGCTPDELDRLRSGIAAYKRLRPLLHSGELAHPPIGDDGLVVSSVVSAALDHAVVRVARLTTSERSLPPLLRIPALTAQARYRVAPVAELSRPRALDSTPPWIEASDAGAGLVATGALLAEVGVRLPLLAPGQALVLELVEVAGGAA